MAFTFDASAFLPLIVVLATYLAAVSIGVLVIRQVLRRRPADAPGDDVLAPEPIRVPVSATPPAL